MPDSLVCSRANEKGALSGCERHFDPEVCEHCGLTVLHAFMAMHVDEFHHRCGHCPPERTRDA